MKLDVVRPMRGKCGDKSNPNTGKYGDKVAAARSAFRHFSDKTDKTNPAIKRLQSPSALQSEARVSPYTPPVPEQPPNNAR